jgi:hypothetical protein
MLTKIHNSRRPDGYRVANLNRRRAIKERCIDCSGYSTRQVRECWNHDCELYPFRTGDMDNHTANERKRAIQVLCRDNCMEGTSTDVSRCSSPDCPLYAFRMSRIDRSVELPSQRINPGTLESTPVGSQAHQYEVEHQIPLGDVEHSTVKNIPNGNRQVCPER